MTFMIWLLFARPTPLDLLPGIEVEWSSPEGRYRRAGGRHGDIFYAWSPVGSPISTPFEDMFDWYAFVDSDHGPVTLHGERAGQPLSLSLEAGRAGISGRPRLPPAWFAVFHRAARGLQGGDGDCYTGWLDLADRAERLGRMDVAYWLYRKLANWTGDGRTAPEACNALAAYVARMVPGSLETSPLPRHAALRLLWINLNACMPDDPQACSRSVTFLQKHMPLPESADLVLDITYDTTRRLLGDLLFKAADPLIARGLEIARQYRPGGFGAARLLLCLALSADYQGNGTAATMYAMDAWTLLEEGDLGLSFMVDLSYIRGVIAFNQNQFDIAQHYFDLYDQTLQRLKPGRHDGVMLYRGKIARARGRLEEAQTWFLALETLMQNPGTTDQKGRAYLATNLGWLMGDLGDWQAAKTYHQQAVAIHKQRQNGYIDLAKALGSLGAAEYALGESVAARDTLLEAVALHPPEGLIWTARLHHQLARVYRDLAEPEAGLRHIRLAVRLLDAQVDRIAASSFRRATFAGDFHELYDQAVAFLLEQGMDAEAFDLLERTRARYLHDLLQRGPADAGLPEALETARHELDQQFGTLYTESLRHPDDPDIAAALRAQRIARAEFNERAALYRHTADADPGRLLSEQLPETRPASETADEGGPLPIRDAPLPVPADTLLLVYHLSERGGWVFVPTAAGDLSVYRLPLNEGEAVRRIADFRYYLGDPTSDRDLLDSQAADLYRRLIDPIGPLPPGTRRLIIVPDGPLYQLPFACLRRPDGQWLAASVDLAYLPVAAHLRRIPPKVTAPDTPIYVFADPDYSALSLADASQDRLRPRALRGLDLGPLPYTRREAASLTRLFGHQRVHSFEGTDATERNAAHMDPEPGILHFACHGLADFTHPLESGLVLSVPVHPTSDEDNGMVQAYEVSERYRWKADLVVLSACDSGLGRIMGNEGMVGLTQAFLGNGSRSVVATLWSVSDRPGARLIDHFYTRLKAGDDKAHALATAQRALYADPAAAYAHPFYWGAFQVIGAWQ